MTIVRSFVRSFKCIFYPTYQKESVCLGNTPKFDKTYTLCYLTSDYVHYRIECSDECRY